jgi:uncharacterized protein DUF397
MSFSVVPEKPNSENPRMVKAPSNPACSPASRGKICNRTGPNGCVEVAFVDGQVAVRDSKHKQGPVLTFTSMEWRTFLRGVRDGDFNLPADAEEA